jgi:hypothetical protein
MKEPTKEELLRHYAEKEPHRFIQYDGFYDVSPEEVLPSDEFGLAVILGETYELMSGAYGVRVLVEPDTPRETVLALLSRISAVIKKEGVRVPKPSPRLVRDVPSSPAPF